MRSVLTFIERWINIALSVMHLDMKVRNVRSGRKRRGRRAVLFGERGWNGSDMRAEGWDEERSWLKGEKVGSGMNTLGRFSGFQVL